MTSLEKGCQRDVVGDFVQEGLFSCCKIHSGGGDYVHVVKPIRGIMPTLQKTWGRGVHLFYTKMSRVFCPVRGGGGRLYIHTTNFNKARGRDLLQVE